MTHGASTTELGMVTGLAHVGLHVADLARSLGFYRDLLGFPIVAEWVRDEAYIQELTGHAGAELHVAVVAPPASQVLIELIEYRRVPRRPVAAASADPGTAHLSFYVDDLSALFARLKAGGVPSVSAPVSPTVGPNRGGNAVYVLDPDGIRVELVETPRTLTGESR